MKRLLLFVLCPVALASCGGTNGPSHRGDSAVENTALPSFELKSRAFANGAKIPTQLTCDAVDRSPPLEWGEPPAGTRGFALVLDDPDAPRGTFRHWGVWNIPADLRAMTPGNGNPGQRAPLPNGGIVPHALAEAVNDGGKAGYMGPCPPPGDGVHHYHFKLYALDTDRLDLPLGSKIDQLEQAAQKHAIGRAELIGTYERK